MNEYVRRAQRLVDQARTGAVGPNERIDVYRQTNGRRDTLIYRHGTNEFVVLSRKGKIRSYFRPTDGVKWYRLKVMEHIGRGSGKGMEQYLRGRATGPRQPRGGRGGRA